MEDGIQIREGILPSIDLIEIRFSFPVAMILIFDEWACGNAFTSILCRRRSSSLETSINEKMKTILKKT